MRELSGLVFLIIVLFLGGCKYRDVMKEVDQCSLNHRDIDREYLVHTPQNYDPLKKYPLIVVYHGIYSRAKAIAGFSDFNRVADEKQFIVCYPQGYKREWRIEKIGNELAEDDPDEVGFLLKMFDSLEANYSIDPDQVFHCGISNGAYMAMYLTNNHPDRFDGMAVVCGNMALPFDEYYSNIQPKPILLIGGTEDKLIKYNGGPLKDVVNTFGFPQSIQFWCDKNGCSLPTDSLRINEDLKDHTKVVYYFNSDSSLQNPVEHYKIIGGGHGWPGRGSDIKSVYLGNVSNDINAAEVIADFFLGLPK